MEDFLRKHLQLFLAKIAITPSATRGERKPGVNAAVIKFLAEIPLDDFADMHCFTKRLDERTRELTRLSCLRPISFGTARKCLNIFLRDVTYNFFMRNEHNLSEIEPLLEIPLDERAATGIREDFKDLRTNCSRKQLPKWISIVKLCPEQHKLYQCAADLIAREKYHTIRVHLDLKYLPVSAMRAPDRP